ncbi:hypothetical protein CHARACLAT_017427 [Characodon lateralis]|uniref:Uncharacterized protein n=1 Tax=Characodon lateralis TaxID=208331 RepID=A0ABU7DHF2_9TELE|nr:hypothetical protein [Characodon lateralis]
MFIYFHCSAEILVLSADTKAVLSGRHCILKQGLDGLKKTKQITLSRSTHKTLAQAGGNTLALLLTMQRQEGKTLFSVTHGYDSHTTETFHYSFNRDTSVIRCVGNGYRSPVSSIETTSMVKNEGSSQVFT